MGQYRNARDDAGGKEMKALIKWLKNLLRKIRSQEKQCTHGSMEIEHPTAMDFEADAFHEECGDR